MEELKILGENLYRFRKKNNLSCQAVANTIGISAAHVCRIENGTTKPSFDVLLQISQMMDVPLYYLFLSPDEAIDLSNFSKAVQKRLTELHWTPEHLAQKTGVNLFHILDFLQGKVQPVGNELCIIAQAVQLPKPGQPVNQRLNLLKRLLSDLGLDRQQVENITEYVQKVQKPYLPDTTNYE